MNNNFRIVAFTVNMAVTVVVSVFVGYLIDNSLNTKPLFIIIFVLLSIGWMFLGIYRFIKLEDRRKSKYKK